MSLKLDWERIPPAPALHEPRSSLDVDLDLTGPRSLHQLINLSISQEGSQRLADWLTHPDADLTSIENRQKIVRELSGMVRFRDRMLLDLRLVSGEILQGKQLLDWLSTPISARQLGWLLPVAVILTMTNGILFWLNMLGYIPAYWPFTLAIYAVFYLTNGNNLSEFLSAIVDLDRELEKFSRILRHLETYPLSHQPHTASLCKIFRQPDELPSVELKRIKWVTAAVGLRMNPVLGFLINLALPWDFAIALLASRLRQRAARYLPAWLETWYQLEALISLANLAYLNPEYTFPDISTSLNSILHGIGIGHPLIPREQKVCNDITLPEPGQVIIITGSNMAGKSTFIKTVGINLCLAYAGGPVDATLLQLQLFRLHTCMRITDSLSDGYSYFYAEVKCLKKLLEGLHQEDPRPLLYLVDEIYRGTNNRERLAGSRALVRALAGAPGVGLIATHDLELTALAADIPQVQNYHFRDQVQDGRLVFDYKLQPGPCTTSNALKIMGMEGLPTEETTSTMVE